MTIEQRRARAQAVISIMERLDVLVCRFVDLNRDIRIDKRSVAATGADQMLVWTRNVTEASTVLFCHHFRLLCALGKLGKSDEEIAKAEKAAADDWASFRFTLAMFDKERVAWVSKCRRRGITTMQAKLHPVTRRLVRSMREHGQLKRQ